MAGHQAEQTKEASGNKVRGTQKRGRMEKKSNYKDNMKENLKMRGVLANKNGSKKEWFENKWGDI